MDGGKLGARIGRSRVVQAAARRFGKRRTLAVLRVVVTVAYVVVIAGSLYAVSFAIQRLDRQTCTSSDRYARVNGVMVTESSTVVTCK
jgi:hypothetical protein